MNSLAIHLCKFVLPKLYSRACKAIIHQTAKGNCFVTLIVRADKPYLKVLELIGNELRCIESDGENWRNERTIPLASLSLADFRIYHYYGYTAIEYSGLLDFIRNCLLPLRYLKIHVERQLSRIDQHFFNQKKLVTRQHIDFLKVLLELTLEGTREYNSFELMENLYSNKWILHPHFRLEQYKLEFYLDALVETGELSKVNSDMLPKYSLTGLGLRAIEDSEEQDRKHTENVKIQRQMLWVTLAICFFTIVQAGIVKLPALLDLSTKVTLR